MGRRKNSQTRDVATRAQEFIAASRWQHSWTVPGRFHPHSYTTKEWAAERGLEAEFEWMARTIRELGYEDRFGKRTFIYWEVETDGVPWRYWTMGSPLPETRVINPEDLVRKAERAARKAAKRAGQLQIPGMEMDR
jgi:hypothetical protein